jgi:hypothetical protein
LLATIQQIKGVFMEECNSLKNNYKFSADEADILKALQPRMVELSNKFIDEFYDYILGFGKIAQFKRHVNKTAKFLQSNIKIHFQTMKSIFSIRNFPTTVQERA